MNKKNTGSLDLLLKLFLATVLLLVGLKWILGEEIGNKTVVNSTSSYLNERRTLAKCLSDFGVKMYGSDACPYCQNQKKMFGEDFSLIKYINCDFDKSVCAQKGITGYPVWEINDRMSQGLLSLEKLAAATGCPKINAKLN